MKEFTETGYYTNKDGINTKDMLPLIKYNKISSSCDESQVSFDNNNESRH